MNGLRRLGTVPLTPCALALLWLVLPAGHDGQRFAAAPPANRPLDSHAEQAAQSVVAAAEQGVEVAASDEEAVSRVHVAIEALRLIGQLGDLDTERQTAQMLDGLQRKASPALVEAIVQMRFARHMRDWTNLPAEQRQAALERFVADVQQTGLTPDQATLIIRSADLLEAAGDGPRAAEAIRQLLPTFRESKDPSIARRAPIMEGIVRRMDLVGKPLELEGTLLEGSKLDWESYRGKVVLVDFFASWCGECRAEVPNVIQQYRAYRDQGLEVIGVNMDDQRQLAEAYQQQTGFQFPTLFSDDPKATGWDHPLGRRYGITALPRAILVDKNGIVVDTVARGERLGQKLRELLGPAPGPGGSSQPLSVEPTDRQVVPASFEEESPQQR